MNEKLIRRRDAAFAVAASLTSIGAAAQTVAGARRYATMSLIGDQLIVVERQEVTGTRLDKNTQTEIKVGGDILDRAALGVVQDLIVKADAAAKPLALLVDEPVLYEKQSQLFDGKFVRLPTALAKAREAAAVRAAQLNPTRTADYLLAHQESSPTMQIQGIGPSFRPATATAPAAGARP